MEIKSIKDMHQVCRFLWENSVYTGFIMYQYLVKLSGRTIEDHVEDPSFNREGMVAAIEAAPRQELEELWRGGIGMCTSWCIAVSHEDGRDYIYGDTGMHRACFHPADGL